LLTIINKGFTLIELLIVMAILGVLAVVVLVAINPVQQLARTRDAGRKSTVTQLGHALEAYYTSHGGSYLTTASNCTGAGTAWVQCLVDAGELSTVPAAITYSVSGITACDAASGGNDPGEQNDICYDHDGFATEALAVARLESESESSKCSSGDPWFVWATGQGRGGLVCDTSQPVCGGDCSVVFTD
jgi:prepilin-type N-terminal cleavage/methylation domain-containing protein